MILKDLQVSDKTAPKELLKIFKRAGAEVVQSSVEKAKRQNSISFKTVHLTMSDSQLIEDKINLAQTWDDLNAIELVFKLPEIKTENS